MDVLAGLPSGDFLFAMGAKLPPQWSQPLAELSLNMTKVYFKSADLNEEQIRQLVETSVASMKTMRGMSMMMGLVSADQPLYANTVLLIKTDDARAYMDTYADAMQRMGELMKQSEKMPFAFDAHRIQLDGVEGMQIDMQMAGLLGDQSVPNMDAIFKKMFGSTDAISFYLAPRNEDTVAGSYVSRDALVELLRQEAGASSLSDDPQTAKTLAMLPRQAGGIVLWSPRGMFQFASQMAGTIDPQQAAKIPQFPESPPVGLATGLSADRLDVDVVFPVDLIQAAVTFVEQARGVGSN
jgi:hypothetical protein